MYWLVHITGPGYCEEGVIILDNGALEEIGIFGAGETIGPPLETIKDAIGQNFILPGQGIGEIVKIEAWTGNLNRLPIGYVLMRQE